MCECSNFPHLLTRVVVYWSLALHRLLTSILLHFPIDLDINWASSSVGFHHFFSSLRRFLFKLYIHLKLLIVTEFFFRYMNCKKCLLFCELPSHFLIVSLEVQTFFTLLTFICFVLFFPFVTCFGLIFKKYWNTKTCSCFLLSFHSSVLISGFQSILSSSL